MSKDFKKKVNEKFEQIFEIVKEHHDPPKPPLVNIISSIPSEKSNHLKKEKLAETEINAYIDITFHYKLTIMAISRLHQALQVWLNGILPILLTRHSLNKVEWGRISNIGDFDPEIQTELESKWLHFFENRVKTKLIDPEIWNLLQKNSS